MKENLDISNITSGNKGFRRNDYIKITIFGFAMAALWSSLHGIILPLRLLDFVAESEKNTYLGILGFTGLILGAVVQPIAGVISDRSGFRWGRRRPYILIGTIAILLFMPGIGLANRYITILIIYCLLQISSNTAQGPWQALIPDLVPERRRGLASGVKSLMEIVGGLTLLYPIAFFMDRYDAAQEAFWLWLALGTLAIALIGVLIATLLTAKEQPGTGSQLPLLPTLYKSFSINVKENRDFIWFLASRLLVVMAFTTLQSFALYFLRDVVAIANPALGMANFSIAAGVGMLATVYPAGRLSDRVGRRPIVVASALLGALGIALIFLFQHSYILLVLSAGLIGISCLAFMCAK